MGIAKPLELPRTSDDDASIAATALLAFVGYYLGTQAGFALTFKPHPISTLWPPNAFLLACLLLTPMRAWWLILLAALPAHLLGQLQGGVPTAMIVGWFASNCSEALLGAIGVRLFISGPLRLDTLRQSIAFIVFGAILAPFLSSFLDSALVTWIGWGEGTYWQLWRMRFFSNVLAAFTIVPLILSLAALTVEGLKKVAPRAALESAGIAVALVISCYLAFGDFGQGSIAAPTLLYLPVLVLLWATLRRGPAGFAMCFAVVALSAILGALHGQGPFVEATAVESAASIQLFLTAVGIPLMLLAALMRERAAAQEAVRDGQEQLRLALSAGRIGTWEWDIAAGSGNWSQISKEIFGRPDRTHGITLEVLTEIVHPLDRPAVLQCVTEATTNASPFEIQYRVFQPDGGMRWVVSKGEVHVDERGRPARLLGVSVDVTRLHLAQEALRVAEAMRESEAHFHQLADAMPQIAWSARGDGWVDYFNRQWHELVGATGVPASDEQWTEVLHPRDARRFLQKWHEAVKTGKPLEMECRFLFAGARGYRWQLTRAVPIRDEAGRIVRWYGTATDIETSKRLEQNLVDAGTQLREMVETRTAALADANVALTAEVAERTRAERALRTSEERFSKAFRASPDAMMVVRRSDGGIVEVNDCWLALFGYGRDEAMQLFLSELDVPAFGGAGVKTLAELSAQGPVRDLVAWMRTKGDEILEVVIGAEQLEVDGAECFIAIIRDVTAQRRFETEAREQRNQLTHLTRVAVLGELTGALAHELNQPLTAILSNAQASQRVLFQKSFNVHEILESLQDIIDQDKRAGEVIRRLRALLKKGETQVQRLQGNDVVTEALELAKGSLQSHQVRLETQLQPNLPHISVDRIQLVQVLLNLIANACEEMDFVSPTVRRLVVKTEADHDGKVRISVSDTGPGIAPERLALLFEPFFTTKERGLGLGLSISRTIVVAHGGKLVAENRDGGGATFQIILHADRSGVP